MKLNKILMPLTLALAATLATTGCKHGFSGKVTQLPGHRNQAFVEPGPGTTIPSQPIPTPPVTPQPIEPASPLPIAITTPTPPVIDNKPVPPGGGPTSSDWDPALMLQDRDKLAPYTVHFKFDSAVVQDSEQASVTGVAQALKADQTAKLLIEGNCDERGTEEYNRALGERRALALREALDKSGVDPMRIRTISYGKDKPVDPAHDEAAWAKNRRGDFIYCTPKP